MMVPPSLKIVVSRVPPFKISIYMKNLAKIVTMGILLNTTQLQCPSFERILKSQKTSNHS